MNNELYVSAEVAYRLERATHDYHSTAAGPDQRRPRLPRRPWLRLPSRRRRPVPVV